MRDIRFRGKRTDNDEWVYGWYLYRKGGTTKNSDLISSAYLIYDERKSFEVDNETVGQFIGLKVEGVEIYENDIISFDDTEIGGRKVIGEVIWCDDQCLGPLAWGLWTKKGYLNTDFLGKIEILGNKWEKPELLK